MEFVRGVLRSVTGPFPDAAEEREAIASYVDHVVGPVTAARIRRGEHWNMRQDREATRP